MNSQETNQRSRRISAVTLMLAIVAIGFVAVVIVVFSRTGSDGPGSVGSMPGMTAAEMAAMGTPTATPATPAASSTPGMDMPGMGSTNDMGGMDMRPVDVSGAPLIPADTRGNQPLAPTVTADGVKEFQLTASVIRWSILPGVEVGAYAYNQQVPGPELRVTVGDRIRILFRNNLPEPTSVHWHGAILPNEMDGAGGITQKPVEPGGEFTYEFTVEQTGTYFYHTHVQADRQQTLGLYGALIVEPKEWTTAKPFDQEYTVELGEWKVDSNGQTLPAMDQPQAMPNYFTINGKSYPETDTIQAKVGDRIRIRFIGSGQFIHPMHIHGGPFEIVETDGNPVPEGARLTKDTVLVGPGERYDVEWTALKPGKWLIHCHINDHITNNGEEVNGAGGLTMIIEVSE